MKSKELAWAFIALGVGGENDLVGAQPQSVFLLLERSGELHGVRAEGVGELERHVAQAAEADDADLLAGPDLPVAQRRVGGNAGAEQRRNAGQVEVGGNRVGEALVHDIVIGVAAHGDGAVDAVLGGVGERGALVAEVLFAVVAGRALAAGVDDHADGGNVARLELVDGAAGGADAAHDFVAGHQRIDRLAPLVAGHVQVGVADAAVENLDDDFSGAGIAAGEVEGSERRLCIECGVTFG